VHMRACACARACAGHAGYRLVRAKAGFPVADGQWQKLNKDIEAGADGMLDDIAAEQSTAARPPAAACGSPPSAKRKAAKGKRGRTNPKPKPKKKSLSKRSIAME
jgi:hypothetical protein